MMQYMDFINQIPNEVLKKTEKHLCNNIALFKPRTYLGGVKLNVLDYHIVVPSGNIPETLFNNKIIHTDQRKIITINPGDMICCPKSKPAKPYYSFLIKSELLHRIAEEFGFPGKIRFQNTLNPFSSELIQTLKRFDQESSRPDRFNLMLDCLEIQIATLLLREFKTNIKNDTILSQDVDSYVRLASEYIETYFSSNITLKDICEEIHVSHYHFIRMFKQKVGQSPHQYLLNVRIEKAKELLGTKRYSVSEAAELCGFVSVPHFSATFKKATGYSPNDYKNQH